jgi:hypothetical protein
LPPRTKKQTTNHKQQTPNTKHQTTNKKQETTNHKQETTKRVRAAPPSGRRRPGSLSLFLDVSGDGGGDDDAR